MCTLCVTLIKAGKLTEAGLPRSFCEDDSLSSSDGGYGSAKADRPPRVYISPARLCDSRTLHARPHPRDRFPPPGPVPTLVRRSATKASSSNHMYPDTSVTVYSSSSGPAIVREFRVRVWTRTRISYLDYRRRTTTIGISKYRCIPQVLAPENFRRLIPLINYRRRLTAFLVEEVPIDC